MFRHAWILMSSLCAVQALAGEEGKDIPFTFPYTPSGGTLDLVVWSYNGNGILNYVGATQTVSYLSGYNESKFMLSVDTVNTIILRMFNIVTSDIGIYAVDVTHGTTYIGSFDFNFVLTGEERSNIKVVFDGKSYNESVLYNTDSKTTIFAVTMPPNYGQPFSVDWTFDDEVVKISTDGDCGAADPCVLSFDISTAGKIVENGSRVEVIVDLMLDSVPVDHPTFEFIYESGIVEDQTTTTTVADTPTVSTLTTDDPGPNDPVTPSVDPTTDGQFTPTNETKTDGLELWIIIVIVIACVIFIVIVTVPVVLCCRKPKAPKINGQNELRRGDIYPANPRDEYIAPSTGVYGGKPATGLSPGPPGVQNAHGRSPGYHSGPVGITPISHVNGQNTPHELTQGDFYPTTPRENDYIDPSTGFYGGKQAAGLAPGLPGVQNDGRSPGYHSGPVGVPPVVSDVRNKSKSVYTAQGYENQGYDDPPPDYDQHGHSHVSRVDVY